MSGTFRGGAWAFRSAVAVAWLAACGGEGSGAAGAGSSSGAGVGRMHRARSKDLFSFVDRQAGGSGAVFLVTP